MTWPMVTDLPRFLFDDGDPYLTTWILHWDWFQFFHHPFRLFDANIFYPLKLTLAFSENLFGVALFSFPLFFAGLSPITVHSLIFLLGMALSGLGAWALASELTGDHLASIAAGIFYAFVPFRFDQHSHLHVQWGGLLPLMLLFLWRYLRTARRRDLALFAICVTWNGLASVHYGLFGAAAFLAVSVIGLTCSPRSDVRRKVLGLGAGLIAAGAVLAPFYAPYIVAARRHHFHRGLGEMTFFSATPKAFLSAGAGNRLYGDLTARFAAPEGQLFFGVLVPAAALWAIFEMFRRRKAAVASERAVPRWVDILIGVLLGLRIVVAFTGGFRLWALKIHEPYRLSMLIFLALLARAAWVTPFRARIQRYDPSDLVALALLVTGVSIAMGGHFFLYREAYELFRPALAAIRVPTRGIVISHLGLGILASVSLSRWRHRFAGTEKLALPALFCLVLLAELRAAPLSYFRANPVPLPSSLWLRAHPFDGGLFELPDALDDDIEYVYRTTEHGHSIVNGYSGFFPPDYLLLQKAFSGTPSEADPTELLRKLGTRVVIFHPTKCTEAEFSVILRYLESQTAAGQLAPLACIRGPEGPFVAFEVLGPAVSASLIPDPSARDQVAEFFRNPIPPVRPPYGWFDGPSNGAIVQGREIDGSGWAAADSGMEQVEISLDGRVVGRATYGFPRPDVIAAKPQVPCKANCGYRYRIANVPAGKHVLSTRFVGKNGRDVTLPTAEIWVRP